MIRAFVALDLEPALVASAGELSRALRGGACASLRATWVDPSRMHVTLRFLGDTEDDVAAALGERVRALGEGRRAYDVRATRLDAFPRASHARVLVLPLLDEGASTELARAVEAIAVSLGSSPETRPFEPHLTLARLRHPADVRGLVRDTPVALAGRVTSVTLYRSELGPRGPTYAALARAELG